MGLCPPPFKDKESTISKKYIEMFTEATWYGCKIRGHTEPVRACPFAVAVQMRTVAARQLQSPAATIMLIVNMSTRQMYQIRCPIVP